MTALDTSALVAIAAQESGFEAFERVLVDEACLLGAQTLLECYFVLRGRKSLDGFAGQFCSWLVDQPSVTLVPFDAPLLAWAQRAFDRYGKGGGSGAGLNYGDCTSYAVAARAGVPILFVGGDFARTDLRIHPASRPH